MRNLKKVFFFLFFLFFSNFVMAKNWFFYIDNKCSNVIIQNVVVSYHETKSKGGPDDHEEKHGRIGPGRKEKIILWKTGVKTTNVKIKTLTLICKDKANTKQVPVTISSDVLGDIISGQKFVLKETLSATLTK